MPPADPARILIVDDNEDNRELLVVVLNAEGFTLETAASGAEALASIARQAPDIVLLDLMMPDMDGFEVASRLHSDPSTAGIRILVISGLADRETRERASSAGVWDFLAKPVGRMELCARVKRLLGLDAFPLGGTQRPTEA